MNQELKVKLHRVEDRLTYYKTCAAEFACSSIKLSYYKKKIAEVSKEIEELRVIAGKK